ncbi:MAG: hypothetical protein F9K25_18625 [Candidatus Contendobacter sp.]|nr:MAG: hypothetical protein F9K25_18625 [Candidatus Contendobacter sp.]
MPAFNLMESFQSLLPWNREWSHLRPLMKALRMPPYDRAALEALREKLRWNHKKIPGNYLWRILRRAEQARTDSADATTVPIIDEIWRSALWEVQSRNRAT